MISWYAKNITIEELSKGIGPSNQSMSNKLKRDNFSTTELEEIAEALDCDLRISFEKKNIQIASEFLSKFTSYRNFYFFLHLIT